MIIRISCEDNDYSELIENFFQKFNAISFLNLRTDKMSAEELFDISKKHEEYNDLLNQNLHLKLSSDQLEKLCNYLRILFKWFIITNQVYEYRILDNLNISIDYVFIERDENGEAVYYFTKQNVYICQ